MQAHATVRRMEQLQRAFHTCPYLDLYREWTQIRFGQKNPKILKLTSEQAQLAIPLRPSTLFSYWKRRRKLYKSPVAPLDFTQGWRLLYDQIQRDELHCKSNFLIIPMKSSWLASFLTWLIAVWLPWKGDCLSLSRWCLLLCLLLWSCWRNFAI